MRAGVDVGDAHKVFDHITRPVREDDRAAFESMTHKTKYTDLAPEHQRYRKDIFDDKYKKLDENDLSRTITAHIAKDGYWYIHPRQARTLTVREAARIQSFPDDFRFAGPPSAAFKQIGNAVPPIVGEKVGQSVRDALSTRKKVSWTTREIAVKLSDWLRADAPQSGSVPWLISRDRWKIAVGELLLDRASNNVIRSVWPLIDSQSDYSPTRLPDQAFTTMLYELLSGVGRRSRVDSVAALTEQMRSAPNALWEPTVDRTKLPVLTAAIADLVELAAPITSDEGESEEPVLTTKGVLRVTARVFGTDVDKRNRQTDGRLAVARMVGLGARSRDAHLGLVRLAADVCTVERPRCARCPLNSQCAFAPTQ
jgi:DNA (cytosine-5)-methyltransferase 1